MFFFGTFKLIGVTRAFYFAPLLCRIVLVGEPAVRGCLDYQRVDLM